MPIIPALQRLRRDPPELHSKIKEQGREPFLVNKIEDFPHGT